MLSNQRSFVRRCALSQRHKQRCPHTVVARKRWAPLVRWCRVLRGRLSVSYTSERGQEGLHTQSRFESLVLTLDESDDAISPRLRRKIRDAIELVLLALQVDPEHDAWEQIVRVLCRTSDFFPANHLREELEPQLTVRHIAYGTFQYDTIDVYTAMWADMTPRSRRYMRTRKWLLCAFTAPSSSRHEPLVAVPLKLQLVATLVDMSRGSELYMRRCDGMVRRLQSSLSSPRVRLEKLVLDVRSLDMDIQCCQLLRTIQLTGVVVNSLFFCPVVADVALHGEKSLVALLDDPVNAIQSLVVENSSRLVSVCFWNALRNARSLENLEICQSVKGAPDERRRMAMWQAYALLDPRSPTSIESVCFADGTIARTMITAMLSVLRTEEHPAEELLAVHHPHRHASYPATRSSSSEPALKKGLKYLQLPTCPGSDEEMDEILELLARVGRNLETLVLSVDRWELRESDITTLFRACPNLQRLRLQRAQLRSLNSVVKAYEHGLCPALQSLSLEDTVVQDKSSVVQLLRLCNSATHPLHRLLQDFVFDNYLHESVLSEMIPLIDRNTTLRHIGVRITPFGMERHRHELQKLHLKPLPVLQTPLPTTSQLAFLGAVPQQLNQDVCRHILAFAGEPKCRKVVCFMYDWIRLPNRFELRIKSPK